MRLTVPMTDEDELREVAGVLATGFLTQGPKVAELERAVAERVGSRHALATSSCTTALHLALVAAGIGPGDEVLVPDFTFPATANAVVQAGARPVLVDVEERSFAVDPVDLERRIGPACRAVMPVHPFGLSADMAAVMEIAGRYGLVVIEDGACALGATCGGQACGTFGLAGCFSFHPRKSVTTGEGGMLVTGDDGLAERAGRLRSHGGARRGAYAWFEEAGFNYRLSDLQAAVGVAQMRKLGTILARRRAHAQRLAGALAGVGGVQLPGDLPGRPHTWQSFVVRLADGLDRDAVIAGMARRGFETTLGTYALHAQPYLGGLCGLGPGDLPGSYRHFRQALTLPLYAGMEPDDPDRVARALAETVDEVA